MPHFLELLSTAVVDGSSRDDGRTRVPSNLEVIGGDLVHWELPGLQDIQRTLFVDDSTIRIRGQKVIRLQPIDGGQIGSAFMGGEELALQLSKHAVAHNRVHCDLPFIRLEA